MELQLLSAPHPHTPCENVLINAQQIPRIRHVSQCHNVFKQSHIVVPRHATLAQCIFHSGNRGCCLEVTSDTDHFEIVTCL